MYFLYFLLFNLSIACKIPIQNSVICKNCKFLIPDNSFWLTSFFDNSNIRYGKCSRFPEDLTDSEKMDYLVSGKISKPRYNYCSIARKYDSMCGEQGKYYEKII
jgi:hypothetical protein